ncbi:A24 family peptidase C-terminal domain-containing protein [Methanococcus maripaludis]|uniref:Prepilin peptidase EppA n=1 Tax=Methanococcus maripaludis (strain DSM 14266 / JCM 13030 / NBRC 101832 / S2 / LL) TaxID=267377 RepID=EPPA_METMP|nr:A24 family peptidase C-terminal domain-containing protein [Methanococcus maripaludis]CAF29788.1 Conserved Hypthetical Protein [Methanococcus maripaludis S2]
MFGFDNLILGVYLFNFLLILTATYTDIKERIIPHFVIILMLIVNLPIGYYFFGFDAITSFFATLILCLILGVGMGGGDVKMFTALSPLFAAETIYFVPKDISILIGLSALFAAIFPMTKILKNYWKDIIPSSAYLAMLIGIIVSITEIYSIGNTKTILWSYIILSIFISRKIPKYRIISNKLGYITPIYLIGFYLLNPAYFVSENVLISFFVYIGQLSLISLVIYALTGAEISSKKQISDLKEGDIIRDIVTIKENGEVTVENANILKRFKHMIYGEMGKLEGKSLMTDGEGLSDENLELLNKLQNEGKIGGELNVLTTYPFVPFVLVAYCVITLLNMGVINYLVG